MKNTDDNLFSKPKISGLSPAIKTNHRDTLRTTSRIPDIRHREAGKSTTPASALDAAIVKLKLSGVRTIEIAEHLSVTTHIIERAWKDYRALNPDVKARTGGAPLGSKIVHTSGGDAISVK